MKINLRIKCIDCLFGIAFPQYIIDTKLASEGGKKIINKIDHLLSLPKL